MSFVLYMYIYSKYSLKIKSGLGVNLGVHPRNPNFGLDQNFFHKLKYYMSI